MRGSGRMSTAANGAPTLCRQLTARAEKPQAGASGFPFMNRIKVFSSIAFWMASRSSFSLTGSSSFGLGADGQGVDAIPHLGAEHVVDEPVLGQPGEPDEALGDHDGAEMAPVA